MTRLSHTSICPTGGSGEAGVIQFFILLQLSTADQRLSSLRRVLPDASRQMITRALRQLEHHRLISRTVENQAPPRVVYRLIDAERALLPALLSYSHWLTTFCSEAQLERHEVLRQLSSRWLFWLWLELARGNRRFGELERALPGISRRQLALHLRRLASWGVIRQEQRVYMLSERGQEAVPVLRQLLVCNTQPDPSYASA